MGWFKKKTGVNSPHDVFEDEKQKADIIISNIADGVVLVDAQNIIRMFNPGAARTTGWAQTEVIGLDYRSVMKFVDDKAVVVDDVDHPFQKALSKGESYRDNTTILQLKDRKHLSVDISVTPLLDEQQKPAGAVAIFRDVEDQRRQDKQRADFISTASHEMRTPVAAIEGYLALALNEKVATIDDRARNYLEKAHSSTQHLGKLFQDLLTSAKAEDGRLSSHPIVVEIGEFIEKLTDDLQFVAQKKGLLVELLMGAQKRSDQNNIDVSKKVIRPLLYIHVDPDRLREVITNIFDNAVKYTETGRISIGVTGDTSVVQLSVADTGPGIPQNDIPHLFQKFYRVDNSATRTAGGTGLGLYISRKIIELYSGHIWVESELDKGSTFYINLPRLTPERAQQLIGEEKKRSENGVDGSMVIFPTK